MTERWLAEKIRFSIVSLASDYHGTRMLSLIATLYRQNLRLSAQVVGIVVDAELIKTAG